MKEEFTPEQPPADTSIFTEKVSEGNGHLAVLWPVLPLLDGHCSLQELPTLSRVAQDRMRVAKV